MTMNSDAAGRRTESTYPYNASSNVCAGARNQYNGPARINKGTSINNIRPVTKINKSTNYYIRTFVLNGNTQSSRSCQNCDTNDPAGREISRVSLKTTPTSDGRQMSLPNNVDRAKHAPVSPRVSYSIHIEWINFIIRHSSIQGFDLICKFLMW
ncbi:hypothetical protein BDP55DRAFT_635312 [Colletotrichum godetiae]|uniref:Uncharacterized protein n=1 Tax=Colletotrichum godetiae TaxID=1209918 RepID=A0AAJ0AGW3_9PEZI|nr:uncharacterized protein BDP55DRAFT_635312 [Colletotrichum godetiae]KAK1672107.1 hypothetical protein BDP55DRAFT_635312 [Colletotrichum godetiae]